MSLWHENLERLIGVVEDKLAGAEAVVGKLVHGGSYEDWRKRYRAAEAALVRHFTEEEEARCGENGVYSVRMAGVRSSSTISMTSALRNWRTAAQLKLAQEPSDPINLQGSGPAPIVARDAP